MKTVILGVLLLLAFVSAVPGDPAESEPEPENRLTCTLLNLPALCWTHCVIHGHKGGYCDNGVCICKD